MLELVDECFMCALSRVCGDAAIGRIPVVSASGEPLMPCKPAKALSLLESGKAVGKWAEDGTFYLQLKFDPKSSIVRPEKCPIKHGEGDSPSAHTREGLTTPSIQYEELLRARETGKKNGKYYRLKREGWTGIGLLEASIAYLRNGYRIVSAAVKGVLEAVIERLEPPFNMTSKNRILRKGWERAASLLERFCRIGVLKWAPQLLSWLKSETYRTWLGITCAL